jgi:hypothetical protein
MQNRVQETTTTGGTGTITLAGAVTGYITFAAGFTTGDVLFYTIDDGIGAWEIGIGTLVTTGTLSRTTVIASSNSGALVNFSSGTKRVFCSAPTRSLVPDQDSKSGYVLTTDGANPSWTQTLNSVNIGNTTAGTGAFTTLSASSTVSGTGFSNYLASPPAIGGTTASTGRFTTITSTVATGTAPFTVTSTTNVANLNASSLNGATFAAPGAIGSGTAAAGTFTNLSYTGTLTGGTGVIAIGTNQIVKDASGNITLGAGSLTLGNGGASTSSTIVINGGNTGAFGPVIFGQAGGSNEWLICSLRGAGGGSGALGLTDYVYGNNPRVFFTNNLERIRISGTGVVTVGSNPATPAISLDPTTANALVVNSSGNVGIGTSSPLERLHVAGGPVLVTGILSAFRANSTAIDFSGGTGRFIATGVDASTYAPIIFGNATTTTYTERARITSAGNLLVGTTSDPSGSNKLRVANSILSDLAIGSGAHFDTSNATRLSVGTSSNALLISGTGYYLVLIAETAQTGNTALFLLGNGSVVLISQNGGAWVASTTPSTSQFSIGQTGGNYRLYNGFNTGSGYAFSANIIRCF